MNKIYKVIWSKAKHTYVVASEIAKGHTKGETTGKGLKKLAAAMLVAAALLSPNFAWAADTTKVEPAPDGSATAVEVYTKEEANNAFATIENVSTLGHTVNTLSSELDTLSTLVNTLQSSTAKVDADGKVAKAVAADSAESATKAEQDGVGNVIISTYATKTEVSQKADASTVTDEASAREAGDKTLNDRITAVKEHVLKETGDNYVSKADAAVQDAGVVKADKKIGENVTALGKGLYDETAARIGADAAQDKVIKQVNDNLVASVNTINKNVADGFTALNQAGANEAAAREAKDNELNERITNEANAIHDEIKAGDKVLDDRITNVKEYLEKQTSDNYVSKADAAVQDGAVVKAANTIGENVTNLDAALAKETAARLGADKAQDKVIEQVNQNMVDGFNTINKNMSDGFTALSQADANELAGRMAADTKLVEATNGGLSLDNDNVLQKTKTKISSTGEVTTSKEAATTLILNKGAANQVKIDSEGVTVGTSSTQMDAEGFTAGGHDYDAAGAALMSDGRIKGANGAFTVDENGNVASKATITGETVTDGKGASMSNGTVTGKTLTDGKAAISNGNIKTNGGFIRTGGGNINTQGGALRTKGGNINAGSGTITGNKLTDGVASLQNGNLSTTGNINVHDIVATGNIKGNAITGTSLNTQGGDINGGAITGTTINGTTGTFGSLTTTGNASVGGTLTTNGIINTGNTTTDSLTVKQGATVGGNLGVTGDITGKSLNVGTGAISGGQITGTGLNVGAGTIKTTGAVETGTLETTGKAEIGGDLTVTGNTEMKGNLGVKGNLSVEGEFNAKTLSSKLDENNYTTINGGKTESMNLKMDKKTGEIQASASTFDETGSNAWARDNDSKGLSTVTADSVKQSISGVDDNAKNYASRELSQNTNNKYEITDSVVEGNQSNVENRTADTTDSQISFKDDSGKVLNKSYITQNLKKVLMGVEEGDNRTTIEQDANNITNTAKNGTITNDAGKLVNTASGTIANMAGNDITNTSTNGNIANTAANGTISNNAKNLTNTASENITNKAENGNISNIASNGTISNEAKTISNKATEALTNDAKTITNKASESVTTQIGDGSEVQSVMNGGGIANKATGKSITNDAATITNTGTTSVTNQVGNNKVLVDTTHVQSAFGDTIYTTWDESGITNNAADKTVATTAKDIKNTATGDISNIASNGTISNEAKTISNKATEALTNDAKTITNKASESVTTQIGDGSEVQSVMNGGGIANKATGKSITNDAATITNTGTTSVTNQVGNNKVLVDTTHVQSAFGDTIYTTWDESGITNNATDKTVATNAKNIQNTATGDITNTASTGTITNDAKTLLNKASDSIIDKVGANVERTMTTKKISESVKDGTKSNSFSKTAEKDINIITDGTTTSTLSQLANSVNTSLKNGTQSLNNTKTVTEDVTKVTDKNTGAFSSSSQKADAMTNTVKNGSKSNTVTETASTSEQKLVSGNIIDILKDAENGYVNTTVSNSDGSSSTGVKQTYTDITNTAKQGTITNEAKNLVNKAEEKLSNSAAEIENTATTSIKDTVGKSTVTTTTDGTTFENTDHNVAIGDGSIKNTTISGNTLETGKATMDYAEVMKDLRVGGTTTTEDLHVTNNATIDGTLDVTGAANFQNKVTVAKDLSVGGDVTADSYKVGDKTYIDKDGINANNQVIRNVGQGDISEGSTDAVSGGQLYETNTRVSGLETRMGTVETRVDKLDGKIDKVGANAAAMANLHPLEFDEDSKWNIAAAVGSSGSETASAVGVFYRPNENVMVNASAAMGTGENMFGGGVSLRLGHGGNKAKEAQMKAAAAENKELRAKVDDLTARMDALLSVLNPNMSKDFPDVPENHWAYEAVSRLAGNGIVEGYEDGKYHGERQMTRYEMAEIIYNALSKGAKAEKKLVEEFRPELQAMAAQKKA